MASSMTGFGRGVAKGKEYRYVVEARSVNNRFCDVRIQAPKELLELEHDLAGLVRKEFSRGKIDLVLKAEPLAARKNNGFSEPVVIGRWRELERLRKKLGIPTPVLLETAVALASSRDDRSPFGSDASRLFQKAARGALEKLREFRWREGKALVADIGRRRQTIERAVERVSHQIGEAGRIRIDRMRTRATELLNGKEIAWDRVNVELALLVEKDDVTEEVVRLKSHLKRLEELLGSKGSVGREIDFLLQEMNREINTIGSKSPDLDITGDVILVKAEVEKIREQAQNLE
ncbi:MAG TPA: YicC/YloC family endoribonuclease [Bdellovibrionota bacterium]|nr:YicC/YloC family endoribonuclease [Bdellovibrionota bacterium]